MNQTLFKQSKPRVLMFCGSGYVFEEIFYPIIKEMGKVCRLSVLVPELYLKESATKDLRMLKESGFIEELRIIQPYPEEKESLKNYHRRLNTMAHSLGDFNIDMIVTGVDFQVSDRYILNQFSDPRIKKVVLQTGTIKSVLQAHHRARGLYNPRETKKRSMDLLWPLRIFKRKTRGLLSHFRLWQNYYFFPYWYQKKVFPLTGYEDLQFAAGICEYAICQDPLEAEALRVVNPLLRRVYVARHPVENASDGAIKKDRRPTGKLLVTFSGNLSTEMSREKINRWVQVAGEVVKLKEVNEIHLRFHPRLRATVKWPGVMMEAMKGLGRKIEIADTQRTSLSESLPLYDGIIGGPSGALRVARAMNKSMFILGLPNCSDGDANDQPWILGKGEGIRWIGENEKITFEHLRPPVVTESQRPKVSDILLNLVNERGVA